MGKAACPAVNFRNPTEHHFIHASEGLNRRSRSEFVKTNTEEKAIVAAAIIGDNRKPNAGYSTPAATGIAATL